MLINLSIYSQTCHIKTYDKEIVALVVNLLATLIFGPAGTDLEPGDDDDNVSEGALRSVAFSSFLRWALFDVGEIRSPSGPPMRSRRSNADPWNVSGIPKDVLGQRI